jgi:hypothetical protein
MFDGLRFTCTPKDAQATPEADRSRLGGEVERTLDINWLRYTNRYKKAEKHE